MVEIVTTARVSDRLRIIKFLLQMYSRYRKINFLLTIKNKFLSDEVEETTQASCALTEFSEWSECSARCGHGNQTRTRKYLRRNAKKTCEVKQNKVK